MEDGGPDFGGDRLSAASERQVRPRGRARVLTTLKPCGDGQLAGFDFCVPCLSSCVRGSSEMGVGLPQTRGAIGSEPVRLSRCTGSAVPIEGVCRAFHSFTL